MSIALTQSRRAWLIGGAAVALLLVAVSWLVVIQPKLASAADTQSQAADAELRKTQLMSRNAELARQELGIGTLRGQLRAALAALPPTSALPEFTHELTRAAAASSLTLTSIGITAPVPVVASNATQDAGSNTAAGAPTAAAPSAAAQTTSGLGATQTGTANTAAQYQVGVTLVTQGSLAHQLAFVHSIETGARRALVTSTLFGAAGSGTTGKISLTTQLNVFTATMPADQLAQLQKLLKPAR